MNNRIWLTYVTTFYFCPVCIGRFGVQFVIVCWREKDLYKFSFEFFPRMVDGVLVDIFAIPAMWLVIVAIVFTMELFDAIFRCCCAMLRWMISVSCRTRVVPRRFAMALTSSRRTVCGCDLTMYCSGNFRFAVESIVRFRDRIDDGHCSLFDCSFPLVWWPTIIRQVRLWRELSSNRRSSARGFSPEQ